MPMLNTTMERKKLRSPIQTIKAEIPIERYAGELTELKSYGDELRGRCPIHKGDNPTSFSVNLEKQLFHCHACGAGGDALTLYRAIEGGELWEAVVGLAIRFNVELPEKPARWGEWADEKDVRREMIRKIRTRHYQRRLLRLFKEELDGITDPVERQQEAQRIHADLYYLALRCAKQREEA
jgi:DNA primase